MKIATKYDVSVQFPKLQLFRNISLAEIRPYIKRCITLELDTGDVLLTPEQWNSHLYVLMEGQLSVHLHSIEKTPVAHIEVGECVGEMSVFEEALPSAFVVSVKEAHILEIPKDIMWELIDNSHSIAKNLLHQLFHRIRSGNVTVSQTKQLQEIQEYQANSDALTGLHNRRWLNSEFQRVITRCQLDEVHATIILIDIDHFKRYNDDHGHLAGDTALKEVASAIRKNLRPNEMLARYGGEEFAVLIPNISLEISTRIAERVRKGVRQTKLGTDENPLPSVTISLSIAESRPYQTLQELIECADQALYEAKRLGRDRLAIYQFRQ